MMGLVTGIVWVLSWFALYLEIYRWRHVTPSLHLMTMRHGNGGFIVNGMALVALGFALMRLSVERRNPS